MLASASPRRRELLQGLGLAFIVRAAQIDESPHQGEAPTEYVLRLAAEKAAARAEPGELVLGADTVVILDGEILGKPQDPPDARSMLGRLAGREHTVLTGIALREPGRSRQAATVDSSRVRLAPMEAAEIEWYVATGEPLDKAGSYAVQGLGAIFVEAVFGSYTNVVGLPLPTLYRLLGEWGYDLRDFRLGWSGQSERHQPAERAGAAPLSPRT